MARESRLPEGGTNLFQEIKAWSTEAESSLGRKLLRLSIGQPSGPALLSAREVAAEEVMSEAESMHEYQDNGSPGVPDFAPRFVQAQVHRDLSQEDVAFLPIPGIKPILGMIPRACGGIGGKKLVMVTMTKPGYPTPKVQGQYDGHTVWEPELSSHNQFMFGPGDIPEKPDLIMCNYPHNPSGQIATTAWWKSLCGYCEAGNIRLFNDAAYIPLAHTSESCSLTEVAPDFPKLSWAEAYSASKLIGNGTGWRVGALVGSPDFVGDIDKIKGNTDSGFVAFSAAGVLAAVETDKVAIELCRKVYERRLVLLIDLLEKHGMRLAVRPGAGFFTLWKVPKDAFGWTVRDAEHFNSLMISRVGVVGVHFNPDYIRYAVTGDIEGMLPEIEEAFAKTHIRYD